jgi:serine/threonine protein kinase
MPVPSEYVIEEAVRSIEDIIIYRAEHPIHGTVNVYMPDDTLTPEAVMAAKQRLFYNGLQMRSMSMLDIPFVTKALEVSQNPNEPYIVTKYAKHDLEEFVSNGVVIRPKRMFAILAQVLEAVIYLAGNGIVTDRIHPRQVKLADSNSGDISFTLIEHIERQINTVKPAAPAISDEVSEAPTKPGPETNKTTEAASQSSNKADTERTVTYAEDGVTKGSQKESRAIQRNIYLLGSVAYQLLFGRKYLSSDKVAAVNIGRLAGRWRKVLTKALSGDVDLRYRKYESMLKDVNKALDRNKRVAVASIPFLVLLVIVGSYVGYQRYHRYKIMTSEAGQAIKSFLEIVNKTKDEVPELEKPKPPSQLPDEKAILKPFDEIKPADE